MFLSSAGVHESWPGALQGALLHPAISCCGALGLLRAPVDAFRFHKHLGAARDVGDGCGSLPAQRL
eukprot:10658652-Alexandrium_andersonii.AAC.1